MFLVVAKTLLGFFRAHNPLVQRLHLSYAKVRLLDHKYVNNTLSLTTLKTLDDIKGLSAIICTTINARVTWKKYFGVLVGSNAQST